jgi:hypothetical protein
MPSALARRFKVDVSTDNATWVNLKGIDDLNNSETPTIQAADTYDTNGFAAFEKTMTGWKLVIKAFRPTTAGVFDPGQELVRAARFQFQTSARIYVRWYDRNGAPEAYSGLAIVDWNPSKTAVADLEEVTITLTGDGVLTSITNPYSPTSVPVILTATPSGVGVGGQVQITGQGFTGTVVTTGVKFAAVNATSWIVVSDSLIVAVMPAGSAGSAAITVTNATGASAAFPYTRT